MDLWLICRLNHAPLQRPERSAPKRLADCAYSACTMDAAQSYLSAFRADKPVYQKAPSYQPPNRADYRRHQPDEAMAEILC